MLTLFGSALPCTGKLIAQAVRAGGPDVIANSRLRDVLAQAKLAQLPSDIIERNIKKASEAKTDYTEVRQTLCLPLVPCCCAHLCACSPLPSSLLQA